MDKSVKIYYTILNKFQKSILTHLEFLKKYNFYLAGGTALALQIKHRNSIDFDFYNKADFNPESLYAEFKNKFTKINLVRISEGTLIMNINNVSVSLFRYDYDLIRPLIELDKLFICSIEDICAMKIIAISQRGLKRDFIDIYFLLKQFSLEQIIEFTLKKYKGYNIYMALKALTYFKDAEKEDISRKNIVIYDKISWDLIKKTITNEVKKYLEKEKIVL